ncbi:sigma factor-like helix-turn-helix DNA-binding protein [Streptomyces sp. NPDC059352]|uniref:sigma factor-like helix-turn-helix DNA-binding protein n=1 Tax=Streptomyces sp. NPDC059352 TaxID=3346810 RepID=UPI0036A393A7
MTDDVREEDGRPRGRGPAPVPPGVRSPLPHQPGRLPPLRPADPADERPGGGGRSPRLRGDPRVLGHPAVRARSPGADLADPAPGHHRRAHRWPPRGPRLPRQRHRPVPALGKLPPRQFDAVALRFIGKYDTTQIAWYMGLTPSTFTYHIRKAQERLAPIHRRASRPIKKEDTR